MQMREPRRSLLSNESGISRSSTRRARRSSRKGEASKEKFPERGSHDAVNEKESVEKEREDVGASIAEYANAEMVATIGFEVVAVAAMTKSS